MTTTQKIYSSDRSSCFIATPTPLANNFNFPPFLFNEPEFVKLANGIERVFFYILDQKEEAVDGVFIVGIIDNSAYSPFRAPFGSFEFSNVPLQKTSQFIDFVISYLQGKGIESIEIKHYPFIYAKEASSAVISLLVNRGFGFKQADLSQYLNVTQTPFRDLLVASKRRRLKKCLNKNYATHLSEIDQLFEAYQVVKRSRDVKGYPTTMTYEELSTVFKLFPDKYLLFTVCDHQKIIALAVSIIVSPDTLYCFYLAHDPDYNKDSPVVLVIQKVYEYCQVKGIRVMDLGMSTSGSIINYGLYGFKKDLGAALTLKLTLFKKL